MSGDVVEMGTVAFLLGVVAMHPKVLSAFSYLFSSGMAAWFTEHLVQRVIDAVDVGLIGWKVG